MNRIGRVIKLKPEYLDEYKKYHEQIWVEIAKVIKESGVFNYSIYYRGGYLFSYMEMDDESDLERFYNNWKSDPHCIKWEKIMNEMQMKIDDAGPEEWWSLMEEVFHLD